MIELQEIRRVEGNELSPFETNDLKKLIFSFGVPVIIGTLISTIYNIVDQIFIGQYVGALGNAATNIAYPIVMFASALGAMIGNGTGSHFSLKLGMRKEDDAATGVGNAAIMAVLASVLVCVLYFPWKEKWLMLFGSTDEILPYALDYTRVVIYGTIFHTVSQAMNMCIHADGSPKYAMVANVAGAVLNCILDPIFIHPKLLNMGVTGAAIATITGYGLSMLISLTYFRKFKLIDLKARHFKPNFRIAGKCLVMGSSGFLNQMAGVITMILINQSLRKFGALSIYGANYVISAMGISVKVSQIVHCGIAGMAFGAQPVLGFNYGATNFKRVKNTIKIAMKYAIVISVVCVAIMQIFPAQIASLFGSKDKLYTDTIVLCFRWAQSTIFLMAITIIVSQYFQAVGKPQYSIIITMGRQFVFLLPALYLLPQVFPEGMGLQGVLFAMPTAQILSVILSIVLLVFEIKRLNKAIEEKRARGELILE